ncbi:hypothetical protein GOODEAATRI_002836 [Goodea atripinnis]|uniref:Ribosomal RNA-processing protein 7 C-terminal domain-containing protein n=1 Tax=Goodea atripinnis TaxID=208336 RepID=A0ABV0PV75_9TELE
MKCNLHIQGNVITSDQPILLLDSAARHSLYVKEHRVRAEKSSYRPLDRTLFVLNIPPYCSEQYTKSFIHPDKLQLTVDSFMQDYDKRKEEEAERQRQEVEKQQEDEEGWVKVTRGHKGAKARPHSEAANKRTLQREIRKKRRKELMNFYTWQHRNTQKERKFIIF